MLDRQWAASWTDSRQAARQLALIAAAVEVAAREVRSLGSPEATCRRRRPAARRRAHQRHLPHRPGDPHAGRPARGRRPSCRGHIPDVGRVGARAAQPRSGRRARARFAARVTPAPDGACDAAQAMREHGHAMASFVRTARPRLATLHQEPAHVRNQALELAASGLPRLRSCSDHRDAERSTLLPLGAAIADATRALRQRLEDLEYNGQLLVRDGRAMDAHRAWTPAQRTGGIEHLLQRLDEAEAAARRIPGPGFVHERRPTATAQLEDELTRRRRLDRPARPALATISESMTR